MSKLIQKRNIRRWFGETSTKEGIAVLATVGAQAYGVPPEITMAVLGLIGVNSMRRMPSGGG